MEQPPILKYKVAGKRFLNACDTFFKEIRGVYPYQGDKYVCPVCNTGLKYFNSIDFGYLKNLEDNAYVYPIFLLETSNLSEFSCPKCRSTDRDRLYALYFEKKLGRSGNANYDIVDFAPQPGLRHFLKNFPGLRYRCADLYLEGVDDVVDIKDMKAYADNSKDIFVCSHVLEHIDDDKKAMSELYRILKPGGWGIAMVPIMLGIEETLEEDHIQSDSDRWKYYMQNDHVRMYSKKGFINNLKGAGFKVHELDVSFFGKDAFQKHGIQQRSVLYVVEKP
jgi:SAM-dependent methyltransferase